MSASAPLPVHSHGPDEDRSFRHAIRVLKRYPVFRDEFRELPSWFTYCRLRHLVSEGNVVAIFNELPDDLKPCWSELASEIAVASTENKSFTWSWLTSNGYDRREEPLSTEFFRAMIVLHKHLKSRAEQR